MGCGSCGTGGCGKSGGCSSGSCNRMNVYNWLADVPLADADDYCKIIEVSFNQGSRKDYFTNHTGLFFEKGDMVTVEGVNGFDVGMVNLTGELVRLQMKKHGVKDNGSLKPVMRISTESDLEKCRQSKEREAGMLIRSRAVARQLGLEMKMAEIELQADARKATFFYIADDRVDFRELIKIYASEFKVKVEMRQIGARQEAGKVGGIGSCGRELCCSTWLSDFKSVNTQAARYQNLSINQTKLSGQCGRLKCCLNYELDTYIDALQHFPSNADVLETQKGRAFLQKKDIFKNLMWYSLPDSNKQYPLTLETVGKIKSMNAKGIRPEELEVAEVSIGKPKEVEPEYSDLVGQISLKTLEKTSRRRRDKERRPEARQGQPPRDNQGARENQSSRNDQRPQQPRQDRRPDNRSGEQRQQRPPRRDNAPQQNADRAPRPKPQANPDGAPATGSYFQNRGNKYKNKPGNRGRTPPPANP